MEHAGGSEIKGTDGDTDEGCGWDADGWNIRGLRWKECAGTQMEETDRGCIWRACAGTQFEGKDMDADGGRGLGRSFREKTGTQMEGAGGDAV